MTAKEIRSRFEKEFEPYIKKGLHLHNIFLITKQERGSRMTPAVEGEDLSAENHEIHVSRPFFFDGRNLKRTFLGFQFLTTIQEETIPEYFKLDEDDILTYDECWSPHRMLAYARENALEICEQLNDYNFTLAELCDILAGGDFEKFKKNWEEENL
jgi:hypothetical protein